MSILILKSAKASWKNLVDSIRILGIDPGSLKTGYGLIEFSGKRIFHIASGCIKLNSKNSLSERLFILSMQLEKLIEEYQKEYNLNYTILRYGSLYGSRSNEFNSIANMLLQALKEQKIERRGDGEEIREYIHVKDAAELSVKALENIYNNKHLVISGAQTMRIKDLLSTIKEIFNNSIEINYLDEKELHHYKITPYSYRPQVAQRIAPEAYHDLGQGLLDLIYELEEQLEQNKTELKISLRGRKRENS